MLTLFQQIQSGKIWDFHGGIHPPARKATLSQKPLGRMNLPERLYVPLRQHIGVAGQLLVQVGDYVLKGQPLTLADNAMAVPVHAPTSGTVLAIQSHPSAHPSALPEPVIVLEPDGHEQWRERRPLDVIHATTQQILARIQDCGIAGKGGAGFPTHIKAAATQGVDYLIINGAECEPYICADDLLMQEFATTIVKGIDILCQLLHPKAVLIGIEDDKPAAIAAMQAACKQRDDYLVRVIPAKYPSGGEKQLIQRLTNKEVPAGRRPLDIGIVMQNVGTAFAIAQAVLDDMPLISRIVTVAGDTLAQPQNVLALIGTPVAALLDHCQFTAEAQQRVIMGGPMMGFTLPSLQIPVIKTTNCIIAPTAKELPAAGEEMDCIRCGACAEVCPATLLPQQLLWYSKANDHQQLKAHHLADCIECGACAYVCPSEIPLVHYYRVAKADIREQSRDELKAEQAKARFDARNERLEREKQQRAERNQALAAQRQQQLATAQKQQIAQAAARAHEHGHVELTKEQIIAEREAKKAQARAYQQAKQQTETNTESAPQDAAAATNPIASQQSAAVAAAIARAKAKKAAMTAGATSNNEAVAVTDTTAAAEAAPVAAAVDTTGAAATTDTQAADPKAAAVAAAIARAKAKKAAITADITPHNEAATVTDTTATTAAESAPVNAAVDTAGVEATADSQSADPKAAAVAAAIARAKAKKAAITAGVTPNNEAADVTDTTTAAAEAAPVAAVDTTGVEATADSHSADQKAAAFSAAIKVARQQATLIAAKPEPANTAETTNAPTVATGGGDTIAQLAADAASKAKKQALSAAIARAKAKKAAANDQDPSA